MTARPGVEVVMRSAPVPHGAPTDTGVAFFGGIAEWGPTDHAVLLNSMSDYAKNFGDRVSYGLLYDACDAAFQSGLTKVYAGRVVGPAAVKDTVTINDAGAAPSIAVDSIGAGVSGLSVQVVAGTQDNTKRVLIVTDANDKVTDQSPELSAPTDFVNWASTSVRIRVRAVGANEPAVTAVTALAGGNDDRANITDTVKDTALRALFPRELGPGQIAYPGATTEVANRILCNIAQDTNRVALCDLPDTASAATLEAQLAGVRSDAELELLSETFGLFLAPWVVIGGAVTGTTRTVPPSAVAAGLIAASDARTGNVNVPAAGANGEADAALGLSQPAWSDDDRTALNSAGVAIFREVYGGVRLYGYRTGADTSGNNADSAAWDSFGAARLRMAITNDLEIIGEEYLFDQIDGQGHTIAAFTGAIIGRLQQYWAIGALFGPTPAAAFVVNTGPTVNTPDTIAAKELHALIGIKDSPFAEFAYFEVAKAAANQTL